MEVAVEPQLRAHRGSGPQEKAGCTAPRPWPPPCWCQPVTQGKKTKWLSHPILGPAGVRQGRSAQAGRVGAAAAPERLAAATRGAAGRVRAGTRAAGFLPAVPALPVPGVSPRPAGRAALFRLPSRAATGASGAGSAPPPLSSPGRAIPGPRVCPLPRTKGPAAPPAPLRPASCPLRPRRRGAPESTEPASAPGLPAPPRAMDAPEPQPDPRRRGRPGPQSLGGSP